MNLIPRPFCGSPATIHQETPTAYYQAICNKCGCTGPDAKGSDAAAAAWNSRPEAMKPEAKPDSFFFNTHISGNAFNRVAFYRLPRGSVNAQAESNLSGGNVLEIKPLFTIPAAQAAALAAWLQGGAK